MFYDALSIIITPMDFMAVFFKTEVNSVFYDALFIIITPMDNMVVLSRLRYILLFVCLI